MIEGQKYKYLAAFDLDKTILSINSSNLIVSASRKMGLMTPKQLAEAIYFSFIYKFDLKDPTKIVLSMMKWLRGKTEAEIIKMADEFILPELYQFIRPEIKEAIHHHKQNGAKVIILSSALPYLCEPISKFLQMNDVVCTRIEIKEGIFTGHAIGKLVFRKEKETRMKAYCTNYNFPLETSWYYGDAYTDRYVLRSVGNPICINPEFKLNLLAKRKGWKII